MTDNIKGLNILIIGSGGRENAIAYSVSKSALCKELYISPGNGGSEAFAKKLTYSAHDFDHLFHFCKDNKVSLVIIGPEGPLVSGIVDFFKTHDPDETIKLIGPDKMGAMLEGSKDFSKRFMLKHQIPTAKARTFTYAQKAEALHYLEGQKYPLVIKADGLAAGKGVIIASNEQEAKKAVVDMLEMKLFGEAGCILLIEDFLDGTELSMFVLTDGKDYLILPEAKDYKRIGDGDVGLNTGGMGAVSPLKYIDKAFFEKVETLIIQPTINGLRSEGTHYIGFIFIGLMKVGNEPFVIEYNCRMGDPETEVVFPRIKSDVVEMFLKCGEENLKDYRLEVSDQYATTVVMVAGGYPGGFEKGKEIKMGSGAGLVFHSGTKTSPDGKLLTDGGRVLAVTGLGGDLEQSRKNAYDTVNNITFEGSFYRKDIGADVQKMLISQN